jgi:hypothetical protein
MSFLVAVLLALKYLEANKPIYLFISFFFSFISILLYEPSILVPGVIFLIVLFYGNKDGGKEGLRRLVFPAALVIFVYFVYIAITLYGMTLINQEDKMVASSLLTWQNLTLAVKGTLLNLWGSSFIKNIGVAATIEIFDLVYIKLPDNLYTTFINIVKIALALLLISFFRLSRDKRGMLFILAIVTLSYIFIIALGRVYTNSILYFVTQPRYQYFANSAVLIITALLIYTKYRQKELKPLIAVIFAAIFFWNCQNVLYANNRVDAEMDFLNAPYYRMKAFLEENPSAKIYVNYAPLNMLHFYLGSDIVFDMLLGENVTRFSSKATHIFNGEVFKVNEGYMAPDSSPYLEDFNLSWSYLKLFKGGAMAQPYTVVGNKGSYPSISLSHDWHVVVKLKDAFSGKIDTYRLKEPPTFIPYRFAKVEVIKAKGRLCLVVNDVIYDSLLLKSKYDKWEEDGMELLGEYYSGKGGASYVTMLFITHDDREVARCK